ncbi:hypothetical protein BuS5_02621 [Desulfosarcina sp. BuS5]|uniref:PEP-CTERM sorting domain-containing protein n=1 Tax=Desulfosarcina sp. BuS5 TaxID=933262 RepID=UPI000481C471|nr:PEP-CTERM sorting domain-containing protein [Desulfosarcina sp. BuS5]WDN89653.1 hypothetical protein BuS5_02621 [Desulfosarcina sp. BuS5]
MKKFLMFLCAMMLVFGMVGTASAISYTDTYDAGHLYMRGSLWGYNDSVSWTFDITDDGFNPVTQDVTSASVELNLQDDSGWDFWEWAALDVGTNSFSWEVDTGDVSFTITSLMTLSNTGTVDATLTATFGDFYFNSATLTAEGTEPGVAPVPEPSTILLMGVGLLGLVGYSRKRFSKKS